MQLHNVETVTCANPSCTNEFAPLNGRKYCTRECQKNGARSIVKRQHKVTFVGVDGEGVTRPDGRHDYVLLSVGDESLTRNDEPLRADEDIFPFLWEMYLADPKAAYVGFYLGYDYTQWLRTLPSDRVDLLFHPERRIRTSKILRGKIVKTPNPVPFPVQIGAIGDGWEIDLHAGKRFKLRPWTTNDKTPWMYICDAGPFFQSSFLTAINPSDWSEPIATDEEYAIILEGKERRSSAQLDKHMVRYNVVENRVLARLMERYNEGLTSADIKLSRSQWYGPGQAAGIWLRNIGAPKGVDVRERTPREVNNAAKAAYYGGWFEITHHGHLPGRTYEYDINSAYPHVISELPCLEHGEWKQDSQGDLTLVHGWVHGQHPLLGSMPHRRPKGTILRPHRTAGWYWRHELQAAVAAGLVNDCEFDNVWSYHSTCTCRPPLRGIAGLYDHRLRVGKKSPHGRALKLVYNSAYGKFAQSIGHPVYANSIYASLITAGCRTRILEAIATHPKGADDVVMVATDGVYFRSPHNALELDDNRLGAWSETVRYDMTLLMPGMYWDSITRERIRDGQSPKLKSRGVNAAYLARVVDAFDEMFHGADEWPKLDVPIPFNMVTATQALARGKWETAGTIILDGSRTLSSDPSSKRVTDGRYIRVTVPYLECDPYESAPYDRTFGDMTANETHEEIVTPDGDWTTLVAEGLRP